jgi:hypothetical protein
MLEMFLMEPGNLQLEYFGQVHHSTQSLRLSLSDHAACGLLTLSLTQSGSEPDSRDSSPV